MTAEEQKKVDDDWESFWKNLMCREDGSLDFEKIKLELHCYHQMMKETSKLVYTITNGTLSKPNYEASTILEFYNEAIEDSYNEGYSDGHADGWNGARDP